jgi:Xaa-Pro aminopeptidase
VRVDRVRENMTALQADAALITAPENVAYYSGFTGVSSQLLVTPMEVLFFTDFRYVEQAQAETDCDVQESGACAAWAWIFPACLIAHTGRT